MILSQQVSGAIGASSSSVLRANGVKVLKPPVKGKR